MPEQYSSAPIGWIPAWADLQELPVQPTDGGFLLEGPDGAEYVAASRGADSGQLPVPAPADAVRLTLVAAGAGTEAGTAPGGFTPAGEKILLMAPTAALEADAALPDTAQVAQAPMETYDAVEITVFDRPVAKARIQVRDGFAVATITELPEGPEQDAFERALFAAMAEEAFLHGAEYLHLVVQPSDAPHHERSGWTAAGRLLTFERQR